MNYLENLSMNMLIESIPQNILFDTAWNIMNEKKNNNNIITCISPILCLNNKNQDKKDINIEELIDDINVVDVDSSSYLINNNNNLCNNNKVNKLVYLDESGQPLDNNVNNSWSKKLGEVNTIEMASTMAVNSISPFILCSKLKPIMMSKKNNSNSNSNYSHIINVTALEGKFNVGKKSGGHPHTNMSKAALNMMTLTAARDYARDGILMNCVDTGWITDNSPGGIGATSKMHETFVGPPLDDIDGASRVLDPIFSHLNDNRIKEFGHFYKDYLKASW